MGVNILIGCLLIFLTIVLHGFFTKMAIQLAEKAHVRKQSTWYLKFRDRYPSITKAIYVSSIVILMFLGSIFVSVLWAWAYVIIGALSNFDDALYFSIVTYTTLGYGDITLGNNWRLLGAFEASIGIIMFGWSTAVVMYAVQKIYSKLNLNKSTL